MPPVGEELSSIIAEDDVAGVEGILLLAMLLLAFSIPWAERE
jgi:hypothetical protein